MTLEGTLRYLSASFRIARWITEMNTYRFLLPVHSSFCSFHSYCYVHVREHVHSDDRFRWDILDARMSRKKVRHPPRRYDDEYVHGYDHDHVRAFVSEYGHWGAYEGLMAPRQETRKQS